MDSSMAERVATRQVPEFSILSSAALTDESLPLLQATFWLLDMHGDPSKDTLSLDSKKTGGRGAAHEVVPPTFLPFPCCSMSEE